MGSNHEGEAKVPGSSGRDEGSYVVDKAKRRGGGGDAKFKSNFRPELWLIEKAVHAKILSSNGKAAQMDTLAGRGGGGQAQGAGESESAIPYSPSEPIAASSDAASLEGSRTESAVSAPELVGRGTPRGNEGNASLQRGEDAEGEEGEKGNLRSSSGFSADSESTLSEAVREQGSSVGASVNGDAGDEAGSGRLKGWSRRMNEGGEGESEQGGSTSGIGRVRHSSGDDEAALDSAGDGEGEREGGCKREGGGRASSIADEDSLSARSGSETSDRDSQSGSQLQSRAPLGSWSQGGSLREASGASDRTDADTDTDTGGGGEGAAVDTTSEAAQSGRISRAPSSGTESMERRGSVSGDELGPREFSWAAWAQELNSLVMGGVPMALRGEVSWGFLSVSFPSRCYP